MEMIPPVEWVHNLKWIKNRIEIEFKLKPKNHENPSPDSDSAVEL